MKLKALLLLAILVLLLLSAPALAQTVGDTTILPSVFVHNSLDVHVSPTSFALNDSQVQKNLSITVTNNGDSRMDVYLAIYQNGQWTVVDKLGSVGPGYETKFTYPVDFSYAGKTFETDTFGVAGKTSYGLTGSTFSVSENWTNYENALKSTLSVFGVLSAAVLLIVLAIILASVLSIAMKIKYAGEDGEYTLRTLFFPIIKSRPWSERIADIAINPFFWLFEMGLGAVLLALILWFSVNGTRPDIGLLIFCVGGAAAVFMPVIFLIVGWLADYYEREPFRFIVGMFMWGVMATFFAFFINTTFSLILGLVLSAGFAELVLAVFIAPVVEETSKGLGLLVLSGHHEFNGIFDGILYGFAIGMGFAFIENWLYFATNASPIAVGGLGDWTYNILYRSFLCSLAHGCFTGATGATIGLVKMKRGNRGFEGLGFFLGLPIAILLHGTFNLAAYVDSYVNITFGVPMPVFDPILTIVVTVIYICLGIYLQLQIKNRLKNSEIKQG
jgi:RsiW-degrading membrane proteinase PrsW (M82 family)